MLTTESLEQILGRTFDDLREGLREDIGDEQYERQRHDFIFHMTDWKDDLHRYAALVNLPQEYDKAATNQLIVGFLYHVVPHLKAAARLLLDDVGDAFAVDSQLKTAPQRAVSASAAPRSRRRARNGG